MKLRGIWSFQWVSIVLPLTALSALSLAGCKSNKGGTSSSSSGSVLSLSSLYPNSGEIGGGTTLTLYGSGFRSGIEVEVGGVKCISVNVTSSYSLQCQTGASIQHGLSDVKVTHANANGKKRSASLSNAFRYSYPSPWITTMSPVEGSVRGRTLVTITGQNFHQGVSVTLAGIPCAPVTIVSRTQLTCTAGASSTATAGDVVVSTPDRLRATHWQQFRYVQGAPTVSRVVPNQIWVQEAGREIILTGEDFAPGARVTIGGTACANVRVTATEIRCTAPSNRRVGNVDIQVINPNGRSVTVPGGFSYIPAERPIVSGITPNQGSTEGGSLVLIRGSNFLPGATVTFGRNECQLVQVQGNALIGCFTPMGVGRVDITVRNPDGQSGVLAAGFYFDHAAVAYSFANLGPGNRFGGAAPQNTSETELLQTLVGRRRELNFTRTFGTYADSEAEVLANYFRRRRLGRGSGASEDWFASVTLRGQNIRISTENIPPQQVNTYRLLNRGNGVGLIRRMREFVAAQTGPIASRIRFSEVGNNEIELSEADVQRLPDDLQDSILIDGLTGRTVEVNRNGINPAYAMRPFTQDMQRYIAYLVRQVDLRIERLRATAPNGLYHNPEHVAGLPGTPGVALLDNRYDHENFTDLLEAIENNDEAQALEKIVNIATSFPPGRAGDASADGARTAFIGAFATLFVTKEFPSEGTRQQYYHFILRCGHIY